MLSFAILASVIVVGASLVRGGGDEPSAVGSSKKPAGFPWIEFDSPRVGDEPKVADPVAMLLRRVEALEGRVAQLEKRPPQAISPYSPLAPSPPEQRRAPENWRPFEFNGQTIYIVPATKNGATQAPPTNRPTSAPSREATKP